MPSPDEYKVEIRSYGPCDKCGRDILKTEEFLIVRAANVKMDTETYYMQYQFCSECKKSFQNWAMGK